MKKYFVTESLLFFISFLSMLVHRRASAEFSITLSSLTVFLQSGAKWKGELGLCQVLYRGGNTSTYHKCLFHFLL